MNWRNKLHGIAQRRLLHRLVVSKLYIGARIPPLSLIGRLLGVTDKPAQAHMARALAEAGIATELRGRGKAKRRFVTAMPGGAAHDQGVDDGTGRYRISRGAGRMVGAGRLHDREALDREGTPAAQEGAAREQGSMGGRGHLGCAQQPRQRLAAAAGA